MVKDYETRQDAYLASGTNELKILEFRTGREAYGINILKVNRVLAEMQSFTQLPETHPAVRGCFNEQGRIVPVIDLALFLENRKTPLDQNHRVVITEFFGRLHAFLVDEVENVYDVSWDKVIDAQGVVEHNQNPYVISIVRASEEKMILLLDYETIILKLSPKENLYGKASAETVEFDGGGKKVLIAEDSTMVRNMLERELSRFNLDVHAERDGQAALEYLNAGNPVDLIVTDIEMPRLDGLALTRAVRSDPKTNGIPIVVFSSIGDTGMKQRALTVDADAHVTKLAMGELLDAFREIEQKKAAGTN
jgi:two-component system, chemotaxis family, chemotaxis protein CheV